MLLVWLFGPKETNPVEERIAHASVGHVALMEQKARSLRGLDAWIETMLQEASLPYGGWEGYPNRSLNPKLNRTSQAIRPLHQ
jgi:hypothetical protein